MKLKTFCQGGLNTDMCILSAHGLVGTVALHQSGTIVLREVVLFTYVFISIHSITM